MFNKKIQILIILSLISTNNFASDAFMSLLSMNDKQENIYQFVTDKYNKTYNDSKRSERRSINKLNRIDKNRCNISLLSFIHREYNRTYRNSAMSMDKTFSALLKLNCHSANLKVISYIQNEYKKELSSAMAMDKTLLKIQFLGPDNPSFDLDILKFVYHSYYDSYQSTKWAMNKTLEELSRVSSEVYLVNIIETYNENIQTEHNPARAMDMTLNDFKRNLCCFPCF